MPPMIAAFFNGMPRRDRTAVRAGLTAILAASWAYLLLGAGIEMDKMDMGGGQIMLMAPAWSAGYAALILLMWMVMMAAMMLPGAAPAILQVADHGREPDDKSRGAAAALFFTTGYFLVWSGFSVAATLLQWGLDSAGFLSEDMAGRNEAAVGLLAVAVGLYQLTPLKRACLARCRACAGDPPDAPQGAGPMLRGLRYGVSCLGCCSVLMGLLFIGGVMNLLWMAAIAIVVLAEKLLPWGDGLARLAGIGLIAWGSVAAAAAVL
jgi:predicted metal-binding membrane protein